jgi:hypothetical protein
MNAVQGTAVAVLLAATAAPAAEEGTFTPSIETFNHDLAVVPCSGAPGHALR